MLSINNGLARAMGPSTARWHLVRTCIHLRSASTAQKTKARQNASARAGPKPRAYVAPEDHQEPEQYIVSKKPAIPESLQIYHAGGPRTTIVGVSKTTSLLVYVGSALYAVFTVGITAVLDPVAITVNCLGIWTGLYAYATSPFVISAAVKVPNSARANKEALLRWAKKMPGDTPLEFRTFRILGATKTTGVLLRELRTYKAPFWRAANLERVNVDVKGNRIPSSRKKPWWRTLIDWTAEPRYRFFVSDGAGKITMPGVWEEVRRAVETQSQRDGKPLS